jgi:hypothetical protein
MKTASSILSACAALSLLLLSREATADERTTCLDAVAQAQTLRDAHRLVEARAALTICARQACPAVVQTDCVTWLNEVDRILPTVVFSAKDPTGADVLDAHVTMDGQLIATSIDGRAIPIDAGAHTFRFEGVNGESATTKQLIAEGGKAQRVAVVLVPARPAQPPVTPSPVREMPQTADHGPSDTGAAASPFAWSTLRLVAISIAGVGAVGLAAGAGVAFDAQGKDNTAKNEPGLARQSDSRSAVQEGNVATAVMAIGAAAVATGVVLWFLAPSRSARIGTNGHGIVCSGAF